MSVLKDRLHHLIDQLTEEDVRTMWPLLAELYYDFYMLKAVNEAKQTLQPGDSLTRDEAMRFLLLL